LILNLVDEAKLELRLHSLFHVGIIIAKAKSERHEVSATRVLAVRTVHDAPLMTSCHEKPRHDGLAIGYILYGM
jgi:hypothetical protein